MKRIISLLLVTVLAASMLAGCGGKDTENKNNTTNTQNTEINTETDSVTNSDDTSKTDSTEKSEDEIKTEQEAAALKENCEKALNDAKFHVLNVDKAKYEDAYINGYGTYSEDYDTATIITLGVELPLKAYNTHFKGFTISGETATDKDGKPAPQTWSSTGWASEDYTFILFICRIAGDVDVEKASITVKGKTEDVVIEKKFDNNGEVKGFAPAKENFALENNIFGTGNYITKIKDRHYFIARRYNSSTSWSGGTKGDQSSLTKSFVLIPLEDGLLPSLTKDDFKLITEAEIPNTTATLIVNENGRIDASSLKCQTTVEIEITRIVVEPEGEDGYSDEAYDKIDEDKEALLESVIIQTDDGDGNTVELYMTDRKQGE